MSLQKITAIEAVRNLRRFGASRLQGILFAFTLTLWSNVTKGDLLEVVVNQRKLYESKLCEL